jgi:hypothetical protein
MLILLSMIGATWRKITKYRKNGSKPLKIVRSQLQRKTKIIITSTLFWIVFVCIRTANRYTFLGIKLDRWGDDDFAVNLLLPIIIAFAAFKVYRWINSPAEAENQPAGGTVQGNRNDLHSDGPSTGSSGQ